MWYADLPQKNVIRGMLGRQVVRCPIRGIAITWSCHVHVQPRLRNSDESVWCTGWPQKRVLCTRSWIGDQSKVSTIIYFTIFSDNFILNWFLKLFTNTLKRLLELLYVYMQPILIKLTVIVLLLELCIPKYHYMSFTWSHSSTRNEYLL